MFGCKNEKPGVPDSNCIFETVNVPCQLIGGFPMVYLPILFPQKQTTRGHRGLPSSCDFTSAYHVLYTPTEWKVRICKAGCGRRNTGLPQPKRADGYGKGDGGSPHLASKFVYVLLSSP